MAARTVTKSGEDMSCTLLESEFDATDYKPQLPSKSVVKPPSHVKIDIGRPLADIGVVTKSAIEQILENSLSTVQLD